jgi:hypothetical protein
MIGQHSHRFSSELNAGGFGEQAVSSALPDSSEGRKPEVNLASGVVDPVMHSLSPGCAHLS